MPDILSRDKDNGELLLAAIASELVCTPDLAKPARMAIGGVDTGPGVLFAAALCESGTV